MKEREIKAMIERHGLAVVSLVRNSHYKARVRRADGVESVQVFPCSVSDPRGLLNREATLRRFARG